MKNALLGLAFLLAGAGAFALGNVTSARGDANDISSAIGTDPKTGLPYLRVYVVNSGGSAAQMAAVPTVAGSKHTITLSEGSSVPIKGILTFATASERPCDLIVFNKGQSRLILTSPSGTSLGDISVDGAVSASGNPLGYSCSLTLQYTDL